MRWLWLVMALALGGLALAADTPRLPGNVLAAVELRHAEAVWEALRDTVAAVSGVEGAAAVETELKAALGPDAWAADAAYVLCLAHDAGGTRWLVAWRAGDKAPPGARIVQGWAFRWGEADGQEARLLAEWLEAGGLADGPGQVSAVVDVARFMAAHEPALGRELAAMKARMMEADGVMEGESARGSLRAAQVELDAAVWLARQVERMTVEVEAGRDEVFVGAAAAPARDSALAAWLGAQPKGDLSLLGRCPADVLAAAVWSADLSGAAGEALATALGIKAAPLRSNGAGAMAVALAPAQGGGAAAFDLVGLASGAAAGDWGRRWDALGSDGLDGWPLRLRGATSESGLAVADVVVDGDGRGARLLRRLLGAAPKAAMRVEKQVAVVCVSAAPEPRAQEALAGLRGFRAAGRAPADGHALLLVTPRGLGEWLALGGRQTPPPAADDRPLSAAARLSAGQGVEFFLSLPAGTLRRALGGAK